MEAADNIKQINSAILALKQELKQAGLKLTRQRETLVEAFFAQKEHMKAEEILMEVRKYDPGVSLATVYRTMKLLQDYGYAHAHHFGDGQARFEPNYKNEEHHDHFICINCGHIEEFFEPQIERLQEEVAKEYNFHVTHHKMELYGRCSKCQAKNNQ